MTETSNNHEHSENCIFCSILEGTMPGEKLFETGLSVAIMSLEGHPIVISKTHIDDSNKEEYVEEIVDMFKVANALDPVVREIYNVDSVNIIQNRGKNSGQEIPHYHVHVIPRVEKDGIVKIKSIKASSQERFKLSEAIRSSLSLL